VLLQGSGTSPTTTLSRTQGSSTSPTTTLACTQGSGTSLPDTLAHSYTLHCTPGPSPCIYKREVQGLHAGRSRGGTSKRTGSLSLSLANACNPYYEQPPWCEIIRAAFPLVFHLAPTHLGRGTQRQIYWLAYEPPWSKTPTVGAPGRGLLRVNEQLPIEFQMGSLQQPLQPGTVLHFGSLEFLSLDGSYDMVLLPPQRDNNDDGRQLARRRRARRRLPPVAEEQHPGLSRHPPRRGRRRRGNRGQAGGGTSSAVERVDDAGTPVGDMLGVVLAPETMTDVVSPRRANPKRTDDASTLAKDLLGISLVPEMTVQYAPDTTSPPSIDQESSWDRLTTVSTYGPPGSEEKDDPDSGWDFSGLSDPSAMRDFMTACDYCLSGCSDDGHSLDDEGCGPSRECFHVDLGGHDEGNHLGMPEDDDPPMPASRVDIPRELAVVPVPAGGQDTQLEQIREMQAKLDEEAGQLVQLRQNIEQKWVGRALAGEARHRA
jgi:hypothetical protein